MFFKIFKKLVLKVETAVFTCHLKYEGIIGF
jgi:hypothetical protein